jgi:hypothetical protein
MGKGSDNLRFVRLEALSPSDVFQRVVVDQHEDFLDIGLSWLLCSGHHAGDPACPFTLSEFPTGWWGWVLR